MFVKNVYILRSPVLFLVYKPLVVSTSKPEPELKLYEKLIMIFPGYRGYKEKELIRETDRIVREHLYRKLKVAVDALRGAYAELTSKNRLQEAGEVERLIYYIDTLASKTRHAPHGYKPLFHVVKIDERDLHALLEHDIALGDTVSKLVDLAEAARTRAGIEDLSGVLREIREVARTYEIKLVERDNILSGMGGLR